MPTTEANRGIEARRRRFLQTLGAAGVAGFAGCTGGSGGGNELVASFGADVANFDPTQATDTTSQKAFGLVYEPLISVDFSGNVQPTLATSFEQSGDLTWRAELREDVTFHDGSDLTAEDVETSFERYEGTPNQADVYAWYDSSEVVDDHTIEFTLTEAYAPLEFDVAGVPVVPAAVTDDLDLTEDPIGTGPYEFVEHQPDELFRIRRYDDYYFEGTDEVPAPAPVEQVTFRVIVEQSAQLAALRAGDIDIANAPPASSLGDLRSDDEFTVGERDAGGFDLLAFPARREPFTSAKVRRGVSRLVPRDAIVESVYQGVGTPAYTPISSLAAVYDADEWSTFNQRMGEEYLGHDQGRATRLLEEGFGEADVETPFQTELITNENPQRVQWCQLIAESMNATDYFDVSVNQFEWNTYASTILSESSATNNQLIAVGWSGGWDPDQYIYELVASDQFTPNGFNMPHYSNDQVDQLLSDGRTTYDDAERAGIYRELMEVLAEDAPLTYVRFNVKTDAFRNSRVEGFRTYPISGGEFNGIYSPSVGAYTSLPEG